MPMVQISSVANILTYVEWLFPESSQEKGMFFHRGAEDERI